MKIERSGKIQIVEETTIGCIDEMFAARRVIFALCIASTETSDVEGISAAGVNPSMRRWTPALDAEALSTGLTLSQSKLPVSPMGVTSPVVITRACLQTLGVTPLIVNCGSFNAPKVDHLTAGTIPARCLSTGAALPYDHVAHLFEQGLEFGSTSANDEALLVLAECVPGGTTTAMAALTALGYDTRGALSSSLVESNHDARWKLVRIGLDAFQRHLNEKTPTEAMHVIAALGDPMQAFVCGAAIGGLLNGARVMLAGGSQMLAVHALIQNQALVSKLDIDFKKLAVLTTKWVAFDQSAKVGWLASQLGANFAAAAPDFALSKHAGLRAYESGHVKEGAGAGASLALAFQRTGLSEREILASIDSCFAEMVLEPALNDIETVSTATG